MARRHPVAGVAGEQDVRVGGQCRGEQVSGLGAYVDLVNGGEVLRADLDEGVLGVGRRSAPTVLTLLHSKGPSEDLPQGVLDLQRSLSAARAR